MSIITATISSDSTVGTIVMPNKNIKYKALTITEIVGPYSIQIDPAIAYYNITLSKSQGIREGESIRMVVPNYLSGGSTGVYYACYRSVRLYNPSNNSVFYQYNNPLCTKIPGTDPGSNSYSFNMPAYNLRVSSW